MLTTYGASQAAAHLFTAAVAAKPTGWFVSMHTADPGLTGANEVTGSGYTRIGSQAFNRTNGIDTNSTAITFPVVVAPAYTTTHIAVWDALNAGNCLITGALDAPRALAVGDAMNFAIAALILTLS